MRTSNRSMRKLFGGSRILSALVILGLLGSNQFALAAALPRQSADKQVVGSASADSVRFSSLGELLQMRLEVIGPQGEVLFDSGFTAGNVIDWRLLDKQSQRLADAVYLCVVTVKDSSGQITRKRAIINLRNLSVALMPVDKASLSAAQAEAAGPTSDDSESLSIVEPGASAATAVLAHDGASTHLVSGTGGLSISSGDFFANKLREQVRLTAEGNVGVGVPNPLAKLDVAGMIRTSQGIVFPDGSIQTTAASSASGGAAGGSQGGGKLFTTPDPLAASGKDGKGKKFKAELMVNEDLTVNGNIIFTPSPQAIREITVQTNFGGLRFYPAPLLTNSPAAAAIQFWGNNSSFPGQLYLDSGATDNGAVIIRTTGTGGTITERMRVTATGNVGIGTMTPGAKLEVGGNALIYPTSGPGSFHIRNRTTTDYSQVVFDDHVNSYRGYIGYIGANAGLGARNDTVEFGTAQGLGGRLGNDITFRPNETEVMRLTASGRVGIGTASPARTLHVMGDGVFTGNVGVGTPAPSFRLHVIDGSNTGLRVQTNATGGTVASFGGNGAFQIDTNGVAGGRFNVLENGNVGIGAATPQAKLDVRGDVKLGSTGQLFASGGEENLRIIRGFVLDNGLITAGSGFTLTRPDIGVYNISFDTYFSGTPAVTVTCFTSDAFIATINGVGNGSVTIHTFDLHSNPTNSGFLFIAIGAR